MARVHYRDGRYEEHAVHDGQLQWRMARFNEPLGRLPRAGEFVCVEYLNFRAVTFAASWPLDLDLLHEHADEIRGDALRQFRHLGVPANARIEERDSLTQPIRYVVARWREYFETWPTLPRQPQARLQSRKRYLAKALRSYLSWIREVKRARRRFRASWQAAKRMATRDPVSKLGAWSSKWPEQVQ